MRPIALGLAVAAHVAAPAAGQTTDVCAPYQNQIVSPLTFDEVTEKFAKVPKTKDEFETTAEFQARQIAALGGQPGLFVIRKEPDRKYIKYDADTQKMQIETYLFDNANFSMTDVLKYESPIKYSSFDNVDVVISETEKPVGSYEGSNAFGAKAKIIKVQRTIKAIFDREGTGISDSLFDNGGRSTLIELTTPPAGAKRIKESIQTAFLVRPFAPYVLHGDGRAGSPTITRPIDIETDTTVLFADIQCAFILDPSNKVLGALPTK